MCFGIFSVFRYIICKKAPHKTVKRFSRTGLCFNLHPARKPEHDPVLALHRHLRRFLCAGDAEPGQLRLNTDFYRRSDLIMNPFVPTAHNKQDSSSSGHQRAPILRTTPARRSEYRGLFFRKAVSVEFRSPKGAAFFSSLTKCVKRRNARYWTTHRISPRTGSTRYETPSISSPSATDMSTYAREPIPREKP